MHNHIRNSAILAALAAIAPQALAGGYQIVEKNARGLGRAYAGEAAAGEDATTVGSNPAAMSRLKRPQFSVSAATIDADLEIEVQESTLVVPALQAAGLPSIQAQGVSSANAAPDRPVIPAVYAVYPLSEDYALGLGVFSNFASETGYDADFVGRILAEKSHVRTTNINPSVSFKMSPMLSFGAGFNAVYAQAELSSANPSASPLLLAPGVVALNPQTGEAIVAPNGQTVGSSTIEGDAWGYGWNAGILVSFTETSRLGLAYRSTVDAKLEGDAKFSNVPAVDSFRDFAASAPLQLPEIISLSYVQGLGAGLQVSADITQTSWSNFEDLSIYRKEGGSLASRVDERWEDALRYSAGLDYAVTPGLTVRTGYAYDKSPVPNERRTLRIPTGDMRFYSLGGSYSFNETASLDLGYSRVTQTKTGINDTREFIGQPFYAKVVGTSEIDGNIFAAQMNISL
ncbi:MAG TPA: outer membrane protein transport protein [Oligoflexus sp.]|uniref:OmpP1/FadL family transporter n=1 Tax=Oligoflexus sp. TaxID=1971216 RepID=UPI002D6C0AE8|nr:outer membrane protein transport protein [Oligoflexus sp.]HYX36979.1 outer membrane protein transport protein [Oligoflexus sp.]